MPRSIDSNRIDHEPPSLLERLSTLDSLAYDEYLERRMNDQIARDAQLILFTLTTEKA